MRSFFIFFILVVTGAGTMAQQHISTGEVGIFYPISTNGKQAPLFTNHFSFNLFQGISANETAFTLSGLVTNVKDTARGVQIASLVNTIGHKQGGVQVAGLVNASKSADALSIAGLANVNRGNAKGLQISGLANTADTATVQIGGIVNKAHDVNMQIGGLLNVAKKVKGAQIAGLINIADSSDYPIALINIIHNGDMTIGLSTDQSLNTMVTFRSGGNRLYGIIGAGYNLKHADRNLYAMQAGIGAHLINTPIFRLNLEASSLELTDFKGAHNLQSGLLVYPTLRVWKQLDVFAGPSFNYTIYRRDVADVHHHYVWSDDTREGRQGLFVGAVAGIQWTL